MIHAPRKNLLWLNKLRKPKAYSVKINWAHPLTRDLRIFLPLWEDVGEPVTDLVMGREFTFESLGTFPTWSNSIIDGERVLDFDGSSRNRLSCLGITDISGYGTFFCVVDRIDSLGSNGVDILHWRQSSSNYWCQITESGDDRVYVWSAAINGCSTGDFLSGGPWSFVFACSGSYLDNHFYVNGVERGTPTTTATAIPTGTKDLNIGAYGNGNGYELNGRMLCCGFSSFQWTAAEAMQFYLDPWCVLEPIKQRRVFMVPGAPPEDINIYVHHHLHMMKKRA